MTGLTRYLTVLLYFFSTNLLAGDILSRLSDPSITKVEAKTLLFTSAPFGKKGLEGINFNEIFLDHNHRRLAKLPRSSAEALLEYLNFESDHINALYDYIENYQVSSTAKIPKAAKRALWVAYFIAVGMVVILAHRTGQNDVIIALAMGMGAAGVFHLFPREPAIVDAESKAAFENEFGLKLPDVVTFKSLKALARACAVG